MSKNITLMQGKGGVVSPLIQVINRLPLPPYIDWVEEHKTVSTHSNRIDDVQSDRRSQSALRRWEWERSHVAVIEWEHTSAKIRQAVSVNKVVDIPERMFIVEAK